MGLSAIKCLVVSASMLASLGVAAAITPTTPAQAATPVCSGTSSTPGAASGYIYSTATVTCTTTVREIWVEARLYIYPNPFYRKSKTCYNTTSCSVTANGPFRSGTWQTGGGGKAVSLDGLTWTSDWAGPSRTY